MARTARRNQVIRSGAAALLLLLAGPQFLPGPTGYPGIGLRSAHAAGYRGKGYALQAPKGWSIRPGFKTADLLVLSPGKGATLTVATAPAVPGQTVEAGVHEWVLALETQKGYRRHRIGPTRLGGAYAYMLEYSYEAPGQGRVRARQVLVQRNKRSLVVACVTKADAWTRIWPSFNSMLVSFRWTK